MAHPPPPWRLYGELIIVPALVKPRALGGVLLANYTSGTLVYRELIVFSHATARGMVVSHIYVDDEQSLSGGHGIWGLPKELATFEYTRTRFVARQEATLLEAKIRRRPGFLPLRIPDTSPFAHLGLAGRHLALAGDDLRLHMPAPRS